jgi:hypothetical protein
MSAQINESTKTVSEEVAAGAAEALVSHLD